MFIAKDIGQFKTLFVTKLKNMLSDDELGAFILVLANSLQDEFLKMTLAKKLTSNFLALKENIDKGELNATQDDLDVFNQLKNVDIDSLPVWKTKQLGNWKIVFNKMRQLRPTRSSSQKLSSIIQPFEDNKFHFNKPFLKPEILWQGEYENKNVRVLYNKFPFSDYHLLIVVSAEKKQPQVIDEETHHFIYSLVQKENKNLPGLGIGFNSLAAGASVNHLHFQGFLHEQKFPIEDMDLANFPLEVHCCFSSEQAWQVIHSFIQQDIAFNCLYRSNGCYVVPRNYQGSVELPDWLNGAGWIDVAGVMTVSEMSDFDELMSSDITQGLSLLKS